MGWDYFTYENQPEFFIQQIMIFLLQEGEKEKEEVNKMKRGSIKRSAGMPRS